MINKKMKLKLGVAGSILMLTAGAVQAQEACTTYTVVPGDSLSGIARSAYGDINFQQIWDANRSKIGRNPNSISVGMSLQLPCADGTLAGAAQPVAAAAPVEEVAEAVEATPTSTRRVEIKLVTGDDYAPYTDEDAAGGGVITELLRQALATVESDVDSDITFVNDWGSHMDVLLPSGAFDGTFPWVAPDCEATDLAENFQARCDNFRFSEPVYEIVTGLFTAADNPLVATADHSDFEGKTICIPEGYGAFLMPDGGVAEDAITYSNPATPEACFEELVAGSVDAVEMELRQAADIAKRLDITDKIAVVGEISTAIALSVVVDKTNPDGDEIVAAINSGIENIRNNGVWFQTVQSGFKAYYGE
jgi:polar amino acid transport system substrate-binding protein